MTAYRVTLLPEEKTFAVRSGEMILDAAVRQGVQVPYSCRNGTCRTCLFQLLEGDVQPVDADLCLITPQELEANRRLLCMSVCRSDVVLEKTPPRRRR
ncbi:2Fe-2S iron-sulfur cluster-binding protein [Paenibacillus sp.]|uniref:2Fe-2S iron-sulfur cluster-binding protein n=1 Tax=Paenibacillus sp. TaxID=58172 RepID=UPI002D52688E|nr:2Fe-2S iron-sulfur cluster-binding protein [Paenibacillus sp.]HZG56206.1 2Fe-2S iron-sulfur cluster-binding protein [Paenibacillus sp.]